MADDPCLAAGPELASKYYRARYYDPKVGRFISEDTVRLGGLSPPTASHEGAPGGGLWDGWAPYVYVRNQPLVQTDSSGRSPDWGWWWDGFKWVRRQLLPYRLVKLIGCNMAHQDCLAKVDRDCCAQYPNGARTQFGMFAFTQQTCKQMGASRCLDEFFKCLLPWI
jgi:RHS repeat-associated protein